MKKFGYILAITENNITTYAGNDWKPVAKITEAKIYVNHFAAVIGSAWYPAEAGRTVDPKPIIYRQHCRNCGSEAVERMICGDYWCNHCSSDMETPIIEVDLYKP